MQSKKLKHILSFIKGKMNERELRSHLSQGESGKSQGKQKHN